MDELVAAARRAGVADTRILDAIRAVPRRSYLPLRARAQAGADRPIRLQAGQTASQPSLIASMLEALALEGHEKVLEIGAGSGWQTALLTHLAAEVVAIELEPALGRMARRNLTAPDAGVGRGTWTVIVGDGARGAADHAPFDAIIVSAAVPELPPAWEAQLAHGGRLVVPRGRGGAERVELLQKSDDGLVHRRTLTAARFVPLRDRPRT